MRFLLLFVPAMFLVVFVLLLATGALGAEFFYVKDGDTVVVGDHTCRLAGLDAPEKTQPLGPEATMHLSKIMSRPAAPRVHSLGKDRYGRELCWITIGGQAVNVEMVAEGLAQVSMAESLAGARVVALYEAQMGAMRGRLGIWGLSCYEPADDYRRRMREQPRPKGPCD